MQSPLQLSEVQLLGRPAASQSFSGSLHNGVNGLQVPWEDVVAGRTAKQAKRRWALMIKRVPDYQELGFNEQVTYLVDTFLPGLKEKLASSKQ